VYPPPSTSRLSVDERSPPTKSSSLFRGNYVSPPLRFSYWICDAVPLPVSGIPLATSFIRNGPVSASRLDETLICCSGLGRCQSYLPPLPARHVYGQDSRSIVSSPPLPFLGFFNFLLRCHSYAVPVVLLLSGCVSFGQVCSSLIRSQGELPPIPFRRLAVRSLFALL